MRSPQRVAFLRAPSVTQYRIFLSKHYFNFGRVLRHLGQADRDAHMAVARRELWLADGDRRFSVAEELASASRDLQQSPGKGELTAAQAASLAIETLERAVAAGFQLPQDLVSNAAFTALQDDERFLNLANS